MQVAAIETNGHPPLIQAIQHPGFTSFKTARPIPYVYRWHRDLLIQVTLDPNIDEIHYGCPAVEGDDSLNLHLIADGTSINAIAIRDTDGMPLRPAPPGGLLLRRSFVLADPRASDARAVWATRKLLVQIGDRLRVLLAVEDGQQHSISDLVPSIRDQGYDPFEAILALVCRGDLTIDLRDGLLPETRIARSKRRVRERSSD